MSHPHEVMSKLTFPNAPTPPETAEAEHDFTLEEARAQLQGARIVIVEDEGITQMQLRRSLSQAGLIVAGTAINGRIGVEVVLRERPDLVLMDIRMPVLDGVEAARQILAQMPVCIVMLTAYNDQSYQMETQHVGVSGYIVKPITSDALLPLLLKYLTAFRQKPPR